MKSQQLKKRLEKEAERSAAAQLARENNPNLMALYDSFFPGDVFKGDPKFSTDRHGNRVLTSLLEPVQIGRRV